MVFVISMDGVVWRARIDYTRDYLTTGKCKLINKLWLSDDISYGNRDLR